VKREIPIDLGRPRDVHVRSSLRFVELSQEIWSLIEEEAQKSLGARR
jgi:hypothetical protein